MELSEHLQLFGSAKSIIVVTAFINKKDWPFGGHDKIWYLANDGNS